MVKIPVLFKFLLSELILYHVSAGIFVSHYLTHLSVKVSQLLGSLFGHNFFVTPVCSGTVGAILVKSLKLEIIVSRSVFNQIEYFFHHILRKPNH